MYTIALREVVGRDGGARRLIIPQGINLSGDGSVICQHIQPGVGESNLLGGVESKTKGVEILTSDHSGVVRVVIHHVGEALKTPLVNLTHVRQRILRFDGLAFNIALGRTDARVKSL